MVLALCLTNCDSGSKLVNVDHNFGGDQCRRSLINLSVHSITQIYPQFWSPTYFSALAASEAPQDTARPPSDAWRRPDALGRVRSFAPEVGSYPASVMLPGDALPGENLMLAHASIKRQWYTSFNIFALCCGFKFIRMRCFDRDLLHPMIAIWYLMHPAWSLVVLPETYLQKLLLMLSEVSPKISPQ